MPPANLIDRRLADPERPMLPTPHVWEAWEGIGGGRTRYAHGGRVTPCHGAATWSRSNVQLAVLQARCQLYS